MEVSPIVDEPTDLRRQASSSVWSTRSRSCAQQPRGSTALVEGEVHLTMQVVGLAVVAAHPLDHGVAQSSDLADGGGVESRPCPAQRLDLQEDTGGVDVLARPRSRRVLRECPCWGCSQRGVPPRVVSSPADGDQAHAEGIGELGVAQRGARRVLASDDRGAAVGMPRRLDSASWDRAWVRPGAPGTSVVESCHRHLTASARLGRRR